MFRTTLISVDRRSFFKLSLINKFQNLTTISNDSNNNNNKEEKSFKNKR
jgi:hypothetical protein